MKPTTEQMLCGILLLVGGGIYLLFRPEELLMFRVADALGLTPTVRALRTAVDRWSLPHFVANSLPGGLWAMAYVLLADSLLKRQTAQQRVAVMSVVPLVGAASEVMQGLGMLPGTFDPLDLLCYLAPLLVVLKDVFEGRKGHKKEFKH